MCRDNKDLLSPYFQISRDKEAEEYVFTKVGEKVELYYLVARDVNDFEKIVYSSHPQIFEDDNIYKIFKSTDFLFYMRNIYKSNEYLKSVWSKLYYFFNDVHYIDREINLEDLDLSVSVKKDNYKFVVVGIAKFFHPNHISRINFEFGYLEIINRFKIVRKYNLNELYFLYMGVIKSSLSLLYVFSGTINYIFKFLGNCFGLVRCLCAIIKNNFLK
jgi:hypothetical protein